MGLVLKNRQVAGNICLVVFLAFMFTIFPGQLWTDKAFAATGEQTFATPNANLTQPTANVTINLDPMSPVDFNTTWELIKSKITNYGVTNLVYKATYTQELVYGKVYASIYLWYYTGATTDTALDSEIYAWEYQRQPKSVSVKVWSPPPNNGGGSHHSSSSDEPQTPPKSFDDMKGHWAKDVVEKLAAKGIINGITDKEYQPEKFVTRAEFAQLLAKALKLDTTNTTTTFKDVKTSDWFAGAVGAVQKAGIVEGYGDIFKPEQNITREEMAVMLVRALKYTNSITAIDPDKAEAVIIKFFDRKDVASWSKQAIASLVKIEFMKGRTVSTLVPQGNSTRAEAAMFIYRLLEKNGTL